MNKILVVNGKYYTGLCNFSDKRSEALIIKHQCSLEYTFSVIFSLVLSGEIALRRLEVFDVKVGK